MVFSRQIRQHEHHQKDFPGHEELQMCHLAAAMSIFSEAQDFVHLQHQEYDNGSIYLLYHICKPMSLTESKFQSKTGQNLHHLQAHAVTKGSTVSTTSTPILTFQL